MNVLAVLLIALFIFGFGIRFYSRYISRQIGSDDKNPTPRKANLPLSPYITTRRRVCRAFVSLRSRNFPSWIHI